MALTIKESMDKANTKQKLEEHSLIWQVILQELIYS